MENLMCSPVDKMSDYFGFLLRGAYTDCTLRCLDGDIYAHRVILAASMVDEGTYLADVIDLPWYCGTVMTALAMIYGADQTWMTCWRITSVLDVARVMFCLGAAVPQRLLHRCGGQELLTLVEELEIPIQDAIPRLEELATSDTAGLALDIISRAGRLIGVINSGTPALIIAVALACCVEPKPNSSRACSTSDLPGGLTERGAPVQKYVYNTKNIARCVRGGIVPAHIAKDFIERFTRGGY